jgi:hypothetical protein
MIGSCLRKPSLLALLACGCGNAQATGIPPMAPDSLDYVLGPATRVLIAGAADDDLAVARTFSAVLDSQTFLLSDFGNDRVLVLDTSFALIDSFGRTGSGPGELRRPSKAIRWNDQLVVGDWNNGRIVFFDRKGTYLRTVTIRGKPESFAVRSDGSIVTASALRTHYAEVTGERGAVTPFAERPTPLMADSGTETLGGRDSIILSSPGDTTHVLDNEWGVLLKYAPDGRLALARSLPIDILREMVTFRAELVRGLTRRGHRVARAPLLTSMAFAEDGRIVIMITNGRTLALSVDPGDYSVRRVTGRLADPEFALAREATTALHLGNSMYVFSSAGFASFSIHRTRR